MRAGMHVRAAFFDRKLKGFPGELRQTKLPNLSGLKGVGTETWRKKEWAFHAPPYL